MPKTKIKTSWEPGQSGNPKGRPSSNGCIINLFRDDPMSEKIVDSIYSTALTLGKRNEKKYAIAFAKIIIDKLISGVKVKETDINRDEDWKIRLQVIFNKANEIIEKKESKVNKVLKDVSYPSN